MAHGGAYTHNGHQTADPADQQKRMSDAELLLDFSRGSGLLSSRPWTSGAETAEVSHFANGNNPRSRNDIWSQPLPYAQSKATAIHGHDEAPQPNGLGQSAAHGNSRISVDELRYDAPVLSFIQTHTPPEDKTSLPNLGTTVINETQPSRPVRVQLRPDAIQDSLQSGARGVTNGLGISTQGPPHLNSPQSLPRSTTTPG